MFFDQRPGSGRYNSISCLDNCQTPVLGLGLGVDFVLPLSQQEEEEEEQEPHQNRPLPGMLGR